MLFGSSGVGGVLPEAGSGIAGLACIALLIGRGCYCRLDLGKG